MGNLKNLCKAQRGSSRIGSGRRVFTALAVCMALFVALAAPYAQNVLDPSWSDVVTEVRPVIDASMNDANVTGMSIVLVDGDAVVWESLAIISYLADRFPEKPIWPRDRVALAHAKSIAMEMHAGFQMLRQTCPMNLGKRFSAPPMTDELKANLDRLEAMWRGARKRFARDGGPFLFGAFTAADAMFAPVVTRLESYSLPVAADIRTYMDAVLGHPAVIDWTRDAFREPWRIAEYEVGHTAIKDLVGPGA